MSVDRNIGIFRWVVFLWLLIHRANASECFCTLGDSSTPVHSQPNAVSETVGFMESKTCFHGNFVPGMQWLQVAKTDIFIRKDSLTACPDGLVKTITAFKKTKDFKTLKTEKTTNSRLREEERRFLLDSLNQAQCDFEVNSFCSWRNIQGGHDDFDWVLYQSSTPTDDTGPTFDHTLNNATGTYIFIESSAPRSTFDTAWIQSPQIDAKNVPVHCFRFWYHMYGSSIGGLNVYQVTNGSLPGNLVWSLTGDQGSTWMEGQVPLSSNHSYSMLISGIVGNGYQGDIAIDDVSVSPGYCDVKPSNASRTDVTNTVSGILSSWSNYTECTVTCGGGTRARLRMCVYTPGFPHGDPCVGHNNETQQCNTDLCPVDGKLSAWGSWDACSKSCANGTQSRHRTCDYTPPSAPRGKPCNDSLDETKRCHTEKCAIDGTWGQWSQFTSCVETCGNGTKTRNRTCEYKADHPHGVACPGGHTDLKYCNTAPCPVDGVWVLWTTWTACSATCGGGSKNRTRECRFPTPQHGDYCVGNNTETEACSKNLCPVRCHVCQGPPEICEQLHVLQHCPADKQYCINELTNNEDASRTLIRRCGTYTDCNDEWYLKYSDDDKCTQYNEKLVYTQAFTCLYCCNEDGCNNDINPPNTWRPPDK